MPADASIYSLIRPMQQSVGPMDQYTQGMQLRHLMDQSDLSRLQRTQLEESIADSNAEKALYRSLPPGTDPKTIIPQLMAVNPKAGMAAQKFYADQDKTYGEMIKHDRENLLALQDAARKSLPLIKDNEGMARFRDEAIQRAGLMMSPQMRQHAMSFAMSLPTTFDPNWIRNQVVDPQKLFTPDVKPVDVGGYQAFPDQNPFTNPSIVGAQMAKTNAPDALLHAGVQVRGQDQPKVQQTPGGPVWVTPPTAGGPVPAVGGGAPVAAPAPIPAPATPGAAPRGAVPGANASFMGANPAQATMAAIAKMKAEIAASKDHGLIASLEKEIAGAAKAVGFTPEQVAQIQPARAHLSALDAEQAQPAPKPVAQPVPGGSVPVRDANGNPIPGEMQQKRDFNMGGLNNVIATAERILKGGNSDAIGGKGPKSNAPTASGIGTLYDYVGSVFGAAPKGAAEADQLRSIAGVLTSKMPRMEGPQSDKDVQLYREMAGAVGDSTLPVSRRLAALNVVKELWSKYDKEAMQFNSKTGSPGIDPSKLSDKEILRELGIK